MVNNQGMIQGQRRFVAMTRTEMLADLSIKVFSTVLKKCFIFFIVALIPATSYAQAEGDAGIVTKPKTVLAESTKAPTNLQLRVALAGSAPFVVVDSSDGSVSGLSVDVFRSVAELIGRQFEFILQSSVADAIDQVAAGKADLAVGPISITADRAEKVAFTQPYANASLAILAPVSESLLDPLRPFLTRAFLSGMSVLFLVLLLVGMLVWLAERKRNPSQFPNRPLLGIGNGLWIALVTMTTVGYGDRAPLTPGGRLVMGVWMFVSMIIASSLTAFLATALTLSQIDSPSLSSADELAGRRVAVVDETTSILFAKNQGARIVVADDLSAAVALLRQGSVAAVVFDRPMLRYLLHQNPDYPFNISEASYWTQGYGFASERNSTLRDEIDVAILKLRADNRLDAISEAWLGR